MLFLVVVTMGTLWIFFNENIHFMTNGCFPIDTRRKNWNLKQTKIYLRFFR